MQRASRHDGAGAGAGARATSAGRRLAAALVALVALAAMGAALAAPRGGGDPVQEGAPAAVDGAPPAAQAPRTQPPPGAPNLVLLTMDTTRADHLGCYGYARPTTPQIDRFAQESLRFERCYAVVPHTTPSHVSIFTGVYPYEHGVLACSFRADEETQERRAFAPSPRLRSYAQMLADAGWSTGGFVTAATTKRITGLASGFAAWGEPDGEVRAGVEALDEALAWLDGVQEPFFLWVHFFDAHDPPRQEYRRVPPELAADDALLAHMETRRIGARGGATNRAALAAGSRPLVLYDTGIRMMDDHFAALRARLTAMGAWDRTTFVITGDHGEGLGQHGQMTHGPVWNEGLHVPFLLRVPGREPGVVADVVSSIDVLPTAVALTPGLPADELLAQARGRNALAEEFEPRPVFSLSPPRRGEHSLTSSRWKVIHRKSGDHALYDLEADPHELKNVRNAHPDLYQRLAKQLQDLIVEQKRRHAWYAQGRSPDDDLSAEERARLRAELEKLGYTEGDEGDGGTDEAGDGG